jgi:hypothetical protein
MRTDDDHHPRAPHDEPFHAGEDPRQEPRAAEGEVRELLRQARVHIVKVWHAEQRREQYADDAGLLVGVDRVIPFGPRPSHGRQRQREIQRNLGEGGTDPDLPDERRSDAPKDPQARKRDIATEGVRDKVDRVAQIEQRPDAMVFAERCTPRLEKRLRGNHEDLHRYDPTNCREQTAKDQRVRLRARGGAPRRGLLV